MPLCKVIIAFQLLSERGIHIYTTSHSTFTFRKKNSHDVKEKLFSDENSKPIEKTKDSLQINVPFHRKYTPVR